jgi:glycosyltransferase involved in cell wall biosynthesis
MSLMSDMTDAAPQLQPSLGRLCFLAPGDVLKGRVEPTIWMRMCQAYGEMGVCTELVSLYTYRSENVPRGELFAHYGISVPKFKLRILPTPLGLRNPLLWYRVTTVTANLFHGLSTLLRQMKNCRRGVLVFHSRGPAAMWPYLLLRRWFERSNEVIYLFETHVLPKDRLAIKIVRAMDGVVVSSRKLAADMETQLGIPPERIHTAYLASNALPPPDGGRLEACQRLGLAPEKQYVIYTGKLLMPEVKLLLQAARRLAVISPNAELLFVGGNPEILSKCRGELAKLESRNVRFTGFVAPAEVGFYQAAADVLVLYLAKDREIIDYITPSKVFDYLQAGRPIVISDFPILREILEHGRNALFVPPHAPEEFANAIKTVLDDPELAQRLSRAARLSSQQYSWAGRVRSIWGFLEHIYARKYAGSCYAPTDVCKPEASEVSV